MADASADPYLDDGMRGFIKNFALKNFWRVPPHYDLDDLVADGYLCYYKVRRHPNYRALTDKCRPSPDDVRQVMAMVRTTFTRHVHTLCKNGRAQIHPEVAFCQLSAPGKDYMTVVDASVPTEEGADCAVYKLLGAPREVVALLHILAADLGDSVRFARDAAGLRETTARHLERATEGGSLRFRRSRPHRDGARARRLGRPLRETTNQMYCRLLGLDPQVNDVRSLVLSCLSQD